MRRKFKPSDYIRRVGFLKVAAQQYTDAHAAMHRSSEQQCADHRMNTQVYALDWSRVLAAEAVSLQSRYCWEALPIGQPFCHSQTTAYIASLRLSWIFVINKRSICSCAYVHRCGCTSQCFTFQVIWCCLWRKCVASVRKGTVHSYVHTYICTCWVSPFSAQICMEFLPRFLPCGTVR